LSTPPLTHAAVAPLGAAEKRPLSPQLPTSPRGIGAVDSNFSRSENLATVVGETKHEAIIISVNVRSFFGTRVETVTLDNAIEYGWITPQEAVQKGYCSQDYLIPRGYGIVKFQFKNPFGTVAYDGMLKNALKNRYLTIEEAIRQNYITVEQAIEGGLLKINK
jgi:hypothetical protein